ncbi:MAG: RNA-binding transcriptional accessory protein [Clostridia bacterium]|nr:RNA-binding transcriptional accessory protein [Clostridia bacterium]
MDYAVVLAKELNWPQDKIAKTIELLDEGNTIPFIARYRKEMTGEMDETVLRQLVERLGYLRNLTKRKEEVLNSIREQEKLTPQLEKAILEAQVLQEVEDLYLPYRPKRKTRAGVAKEKGLEPLALLFLDGNTVDTPAQLAQSFINAELGVESIEDAVSGAQDIVAEIVAEDAEIRKIARNLVWAEGLICSKAQDPEAITPYEMYYDYQEPVKKIPPHRILAVNRGEKEKALQVKILQPEERIIERISKKYLEPGAKSCQDVLVAAIKDGYKRLISPAIEREIRNELTSVAEEQAIKIFAQNLHNLLLQPPVKGKVVLGVDPGYRTGCKLAVVDETGKVLEVGVMYPHPPQNQKQEAKEVLARLINKWKVDIIAIGNGTASRETELLAADLIKDLPAAVQYIIVSEAGASVYSASKLAKEEFPDYDLSLRSAVSIARRLQDPLAELVKIEPKAVGVGQYQHDVTPKKLDEALAGVVETCVNSVGVEINTASSALLQYVAGLTKSTADGIIKYREEKGKILKREELLNVPRLGQKAFTQCAGFIRIADGLNPLDNTPVHPESYTAAEKLLELLGFRLNDLNSEKMPEIRQALTEVNIKEMAEKLAVGEPTLKDIVEALQKPGRDPREELPPPLFRTDVLTMEDLKPGMELQGTVRNVVDFGAFVDIGVKQDGLVHISQLGEKYVKHPMEVVAVGDIVKVKVLEVDINRGRISLTMRC